MKRRTPSLSLPLPGGGGGGGLSAGRVHFVRGSKEVAINLIMISHRKDAKGEAGFPLMFSEH